MRNTPSLIKIDETSRMINKFSALKIIFLLTIFALMSNISEAYIYILLIFKNIFIILTYILTIFYPQQCNHNGGMRLRAHRNCGDCGGGAGGRRRFGRFNHRKISSKNES